MLSDYERRELALIEQGLDADPRLAACLGGARRRGRWPIRLLLALGAVLFVTGPVTSTGGLVAQGLLAAGAGLAWSRWRAWRAAKAQRASI